MNYKLVVDSCCNVTKELLEKVSVTSVPLTITMGEKVLVDDAALDVPAFIEEMTNWKEKITSGAPSPYEFSQAYKTEEYCLVVTISSKLSGSHASAEAAVTMVEDGADRIHVFETKSGCAGLTLITLFLDDLIQKNLELKDIIAQTNVFIEEMKTYFVVEDLNTMIDNGRYSGTTGGSTLNFKTILEIDGEGLMVKRVQVRGQNQLIEKISEFIIADGRDTKGRTAVLDHCNNPEAAAAIADSIRERFDFAEVFVNSANALSSMYIKNKGMTIAF
ncbi:MAG: DegV family protein [Lachnospiraceae bacterium]